MDDANRNILVKQQQEKAMRFLAQADEMYNLHYWDLAANRYYYNGIESTNISIPKIYEPIDYEKTTRKEFLKLCRYRYDNYQGMRDLHFGADAPKVSQKVIDYETGKPGFDLLETDYH